MAETSTMEKEIVAAGPEDPNSGVKRVTAGPERLMQFLRDTRQEMRKVHTPTRAEVQSTTVVVVITVFLFAAYFELVDLVVGKGIDQMFVHLTKH
jgi:preprotein translocase subunit SecE